MYDCLPDLVVMFLGVFGGVENVSLTLVFDAVVECSDVHFFVGKSKCGGLLECKGLLFVF